MGLSGVKCSASRWQLCFPMASRRFNYPFSVCWQFSRSSSDWERKENWRGATPTSRLSLSLTWAFGPGGKFVPPESIWQICAIGLNLANLCHWTQFGKFRVNATNYPLTHGWHAQKNWERFATKKPKNWTDAGMWLWKHVQGEQIVSIKKEYFQNTPYFDAVCEI